ncbi:zinc-type alcohol dehydrogenase-like protein 5 [Elsinoe australis]|uniref:Zinc-type alcohol dehydrogenase-like protein 5 n=1 Tax=Elsinoe australis TaxID=40998 RepID=A0A4U7APJ7_9PEZI|nr:zinc-type alcohol dehydrogenase-like protein 5 [Elsinoe australis]
MPKVFRNSTNRSYEDIVPRDEPIPKTSWGQAVIKVKAVSLNYRDLVMSGSANPLGAKKDLVPLSDASGVIVEVGEGVEDVQVGDHVVAVFDQSFLYGQRKDWTHSYGGAIDEFLREYADVPASSLVKIPKDSPLTWAQWACLPCAGVTAWNALYGLVPLRSAQTVLLEGTGGVSIIGVLLAKAAGARIIITSSSDEKLKIVKENGIHHEQMPNIIMQAVMQACVLRGIYVGPKTMLEDLVEVVSAHNRPMPVSDTFEFTQEGVLAAFRHLKDGKHIGKICIDVDRKSNDV